MLIRIPRTAAVLTLAVAALMIGLPAMASSGSPEGDGQENWL